MSDWARGTVFAVAPDGTGFTIVHTFTGGAADGSNPYGALMQGPDGTLYGPTWVGGSSDRGTVFAVAPDGTGFTILHNFTGGAADGANPWAGLIQGPDGTLYGMTQFGGSGNSGTVFAVTPNGSGFTILHTFTGGAADGANPYGVGFWGGIRADSGAVVDVTDLRLRSMEACGSIQLTIDCAADGQVTLSVNCGASFMRENRAGVDKGLRARSSRV